MAMEALTITMMNLYSKKMYGEPIADRAEVLPPIMLDAPEEHLNLYKEWWIQMLDHKMMHWRNDYDAVKDRQGLIKELMIPLNIAKVKKKGAREFHWILMIVWPS